MSATIKFIHTKPTLGHLFPVDLVYSSDQTATAFNGDVGLVSSGYEEVISPAEVKSRKSELETIRPDLVELLWPSEEECLLDMLIDESHPFYMGPDTNLSTNPFSLTWTVVATYDTLDNLKNSYVSSMGTADTEAAGVRQELEVTLQQKVFVDGVDVTSSCDWLVNL